MRMCALVLSLAMIPAIGVADDPVVKPLTPAEAAKKIDEKCTVALEVKSVGKGKGVFFLNSRENFKDDDNFTIFINDKGVKSLQEAKIDDPVDYYKDKKVFVTGTVKLYRDKPEIIVEMAEQIKMEEKK
jgi:DNA/RNA endonuclease YhcR with UshA esterase domain